MNIAQRSADMPLRRIDGLGQRTVSVAFEALGHMMPIERWTDRNALLDAFENCVERFGISHWLIAAVPMPGGDIRQTIVRVRWPEGWMQRYLRDDLARVDPVLIAAIGSRMAMREFDIVAATAHLPQSATVLSDYAGQGLSHHMAVPCMRVGQYHAVVTFASREGVSDDDAELLFAATRRVIDRLYQVAPDLLHRSGQLTARERQIVTLTAEGKTSNEIAGELGI
jgi:hypothetical protein